MTKEEYISALKEAEMVLNNLVKDARSANNKVDLTVITDQPNSLISIVSVTVT